MILVNVFNKGLDSGPGSVLRKFMYDTKLRKRAVHMLKSRIAERLEKDGGTG